MAMRGVETRIQEIRHRIFTEVARMAYHTEWPTDRRIEALPFDIMPGEVGNIRNDIFPSSALSSANACVWRWVCRAAVPPSTAPLSDNIEAATREATTRRRSSTRDQVRVPRLQGEQGHGHGRLSGLHGASVR